MNASRQCDSGVLISSLDSATEGGLFVSVPPSMLLRDVIYNMNELFATTAAIVNRQGRILGWLTQSLIAEHFATDADQALRSPCYSLLGNDQAHMAA